MGWVDIAHAQTISLPVTGKFEIGDNAEWANLTFNNSLWDYENVGQSWATTGQKESVFAWFRTKIIIPSRRKGAIEKGNGLKLSLGKIDNVDQTFFNGRLIGQTGTFCPQYETKWDVPRVYFISPEGIHHDTDIHPRRNGNAYEIIV